MYLPNLPDAEVLLIEAIPYADFKTKFELPVIVLFSVTDGYNYQSVCKCVLLFPAVNYMFKFSNSIIRNGGVNFNYLPQRGWEVVEGWCWGRSP